MKKLFYLLFMFIGLVLTSCEPMEDIHDEIDAEIEGRIAGSVDPYTLTEEDYTEILDLGFANFGSVEEAKDLVPVVLNEVFPSFGEGSSVEVLFDIYAPKRDEKDLIVYYTSDDDYTEYTDSDFNNFDDLDQVFEMVEDKFSDVPNRTLVSVNYDYYSGSVEERNDGFLLVDGDWIYVSGFTEDEYNAMGESYPNFSSEDEAEAKIPVFLTEKFKYEPAEKGTILPVMYKLYTNDKYDLDEDGDTNERKTYSFVKYFIFNGTDWVVYNNLVTESLKFGHDGTNWVPDSTIVYTLTQEDYASVGNGQYGNFDYWNGDDIAEAHAKIITILEAKYPDAEVGQKFLITYKGYNGSTNNYTQRFVVNDSGEIVKE